MKYTRTGERLVQYHDEGLRAGLLIEDTEWERSNEVQIRTIGPNSRVIWIARANVVEVTQ